MLWVLCEGCGFWVFGYVGFGCVGFMVVVGLIVGYELGFGWCFRFCGLV